MNKWLLLITLPLLPLVGCQPPEPKPNIIRYEKLYTYNGCTYYRFNTSKKAYSSCGTWKLIEGEPR